MKEDISEIRGAEQFFHLLKEHDIISTITLANGNGNPTCSIEFGFGNFMADYYVTKEL